MPTIRCEPTAPPPLRGSSLDPLSVVGFLQHQSGALRAALSRPRDRRCVQRAVRGQDHAHDAWLALIGRARRDGEHALGDDITALYSLHGRVAGSLERGFDPLLHPAMERRLRMLLIAQVEHLTARAVAHVLNSPAVLEPTG